MPTRALCVVAVFWTRLEFEAGMGAKIGPAGLETINNPTFRPFRLSRQLGSWCHEHATWNFGDGPTQGPRDAERHSTQKGRPQGGGHSGAPRWRAP